MKTKRNYERPCIKVVKLRQRTRLLQASANTNVNVSYYEEDI